MASIALHVTSSSLVPTPLPRVSPPRRSQGLPVSSNSLHSRFFGLKLFSSLTNPLPSPRAKMNTVVDKVNKGQVPVPHAFKLKDQEGRDVTLSMFKGKPVVVYFYPADESPGCTKQACAFRDSYEKFKKAGAEIVGISSNDPSSHKAFAEKYRLPFSLMADEDDKVRKEWGVPGDIYYLGDRRMFLTRMAPFNSSTTTNSSPKSTSMKPSSYFRPSKNPGLFSLSAILSTNPIYVAELFKLL